MNVAALRELLEGVRGGAVAVEAAMERLRGLPFEDLGFAKVDHHRAIRCGFPEVIYCAGKTPPQVADIFASCARGGGNVLGTRASPEIAAAVAARTHAARFDPTSRTITLRQKPAQPSPGTVAILAAGTSDLPVAEEARFTAEIMDQRTAAVYDVGVAGIHRLLAHAPVLQSANVLVVVAGMEGALASVVGGLVDRPVIAVPTSIGYGASFHGLAALLAMLNSCASNVAVVNIDNGFSAGYIAAMINRRTGSPEPAAPAE
jgi:pyridinium-3,5-biscarboxylic acid mononucleotide synthase